MEPKNETGLDDLLLSSAQAAKLIMVSLTTLYARAEAGWIKRAGPDQWHAVAVVRGNNRYLMDRAKRASQTGTLSRVQEARARQIELQTAREQGDVISMKDSLAATTELVGRLKSRMDAIPTRCFRDLGLREIVRREIDMALIETADDMARVGAELLAEAERA